MASRPSSWWSSTNITKHFLSRMKKAGPPWLGRSEVCGSARQADRSRASWASTSGGVVDASGTRARAYCAGVDAMDALFAGLVDDAAVFPPGNASVPDAVRRHREHRAAWYAPLIGPLVVPDTELAAGVAGGDRAARRGRPDELAVSVVISGGAGGLVALARRDLPGLESSPSRSPCATSTTWPATRSRVVAAAEELDPDEVTVFVEVPVRAAAGSAPSR